DEIILPVKYGGDPRDARIMLEKVANEILGDQIERSREAWQAARRIYLLDEEQVAPVVTLQANDNWIEFTLRYSSNTGKDGKSKTACLRASLRSSIILASVWPSRRPRFN
ncbi:MAG: hypothetical protein MUP44_02460, partial [Anaerolineales bacterium]|nr:hypothetical protein [Anaerolineales bacterium]